MVSALIENGLYRSLLPQSVGGAEAPPEVFMQMLEEIAKADASTAWCLGQCSVCAMTAAYLDADAAHEIFGKPNDILAWGAIAHAVQVVPGGYRITARWDFASGSRQANWLGAHVQVVEADGTQAVAAERRAGNPHHRVSGDRGHHVRRLGRDRACSGTGTDSYSVDDLFIPENFSALRDDLTALREKARSTAHHLHDVRAGFCAVSLGVARATLDAAIDWRAARHRSASRRCARTMPFRLDRPHRRQFARGARLYLWNRRRVWRDVTETGQLTEEHRMALRLASTWTIHQAASVVDTAYHMAGATAVFRANKFERRFRDMHAIAQQIQARDTHYEDVGTRDPAAPARCRHVTGRAQFAGRACEIPRTGRMYP